MNGLSTHRNHHPGTPAARPGEVNGLNISELVLTSVIDNLTASIVLVDQDRRVVVVNKAGRAFLKRSPGEILGMRWGEVTGCIHATSSDQGCGFSAECWSCTINQTVEQVFKSKTGTDFGRVRIELEKGVRRTLTVSTRFLLIEASEAVLVSFEDITANEENEGLRLDNARLSSAVETAGAVCHELNQPLMALSGYLQLILSERPADDAHLDMLMKMSRQVERMGAITHKLMGINRYRTKPYAGISTILDIGASSGKPDGLLTKEQIEILTEGL